MAHSFLDRFRTRAVPAQPLLSNGPAQVRAYWEALRQGSALPSRATLDPRGFAGVLDRVFLADRIGKGLVQVTVAGSALCEFAGTDLRGLPLSCLFDPGSRPVLVEALEQVLAGPSVAEIDLGSDRERQGLGVARLLLLPLGADGDRQQVLGAMGLAEGLRPCKLQVLGRRMEELSLPHTEPAQVPGPAPVGRGSHLRLVAVNA